MKKSLYIFLFITICNMVSYSQAFLSIDTVSGLQDTLTYQTSYNYTVSVKNIGSQPFTGTIDIMVGVDSTGGNSLTVSTVATTSLITLNPLDTISQNITVAISNLAGFSKVNGNGNTVVIWPYASGVLNDSIRKTIYFIDTTTTGIIYDRLLEKSIICFPNPTNGIMAIKLSSGVFDEICVRNMYGQIVSRQNFENKIDMTQLPRGIYFIELSDREHTKKVVKKILKE